MAFQMIDLTEEQKAVVAHRAGMLLVKAWAGSGKTTVGCCHMKALIEEDGVDPARILNTTFSKRGATDMAAKGKRLGVPHGVRYSTLHAVAFKILREARAAAAQRPGAKPPEYFVVDSGSQYKLDHIIKTELDRQARRLGIARDSKGRPAGLRPRDVATEIGLAKAYMVGPEAWDVANDTPRPDYVTWATTREREPLNPGPAKLIGAIYAAYEKAKRNPVKYDGRKFKKHAGQIFLTFDDMLYTVAKGILQGARWVSDFEGLYEWAFVDEVQDNSWPQWILCFHLTKRTGNLVAVGDDQQSIYAFRGAQPKLMRDYLARDGVRMLEMTANFRSRDGIIEAANGLLANATDKMGNDPMRAGRIDTAGGVPTLRSFDSPKEEGDVVASEVENLLSEGHDPEEIAVLYRTNAQSGPVEVALMSRGIRYRVAGRSFFERALVRTSIAYLATALNEKDADAWGRCYCLPLRGIGGKYLESYPTAAAARTAFDNGEMRRNGYRRGTREVLDYLDGIRNVLEAEGLGAALAYITEDVGVRKHYRDEDADDTDVTEADEMAGALVECGAKLNDATALLDYARDMGGLRKTEPRNDGSTAHLPLVTLSTAHASKGLEWGTIFFIGFVREVFPHALAPYEEERRLAYVTITRAKEACHVSYTQTTVSGRGGGPSPLVAEVAALAAKCLDAIVEEVEEAAA